MTIPGRLGQADGLSRCFVRQDGNEKLFPALHSAEMYAGDLDGLSPCNPWQVVPSLEGMNFMTPSGTILNYNAYNYSTMYLHVFTT